MENSKDVTIGVRNFRVTRMTAMIGSWVLNILLSAAFKAQSGGESDSSSVESASFKSLSEIEKADASISAMWITAGSEISEENYAKIQRQCLRTCSMYIAESAPPIPLLATDGRWAIAELEQDIKTINDLIQETLRFNLAPFFTESASKTKAEAAAQAINQPAFPTATALPLGR